LPGPTGDLLKISKEQKSPKNSQRLKRQKEKKKIRDTREVTTDSGSINQKLKRA